MIFKREQGRREPRIIGFGMTGISSYGRGSFSISLRSHGKAFRFPHGRQEGGNRGLPLSVTHNFLLKICATPTRAVALRLSIPAIIFIQPIIIKHPYQDVLLLLVWRWRESNPRANETPKYIYMFIVFIGFKYLS